MKLYLIPVFRGCMLQKRFLFILKHIYFVNINRKTDRFERERFLAVQDF